MPEEKLAEKPKTFIVISSIMTWANSEVIKTEKVVEKEEAEEGEDEEKEEVEKEEEES